MTGKTKNLSPASELSCLICTSPTTSCHFGIAACRACAAFFRRSITDNKQYKCGSNGQCTINKDIRTCCRKCRLNKCFAVGMIEKNVQGRRDPIVPKIEDPSPLCVTFGLESEASPCTSYNSVTSPESVYSSPGLIPRLLANYRELCTIRRSAEIALNPAYYQTVEREGPLAGLCFLTASAGSLLFRAHVPSTVEFLAKTFFEFGLLNDSEKWILLRPFLVAFGWVDNGFKTYKRIPRELFTRICVISETTYFDISRCDEWVATIGDGADEFKAGVSSVFKRMMQPDRLKGIQALDAVKLQDEEFVALVGLLFWNTCVQNQTENLKRLISQVRTRILEELHEFERVNNSQFAASRFGQVLDLNNVAVMEMHRCRDSLEVYTILDVIKQNDFFYEMVTSIR